MDLRFLVPGLTALALVLAACGDGADQPPASTETPDAGDFGPAPDLTGHVTAVSPGHAQVIPQAQTRTADPGDPRGVCAETDFEGLSGAGLWFHMAVDAEIVTDKVIWIVDSMETPTRGRVCYDPAEGLSVGRHTAAVSVRDPNNLNAPPREIVAWAFEVTE
jgi:hypothetical protein